MDDTGAGAGGPSVVAVGLLEHAADAFRTWRAAFGACFDAVHALDMAGVAAETAHPSTASLLQQHLHLDRAEATSLLRAARSVSETLSPTGATTPAPLPATADAVRAGAIGENHLRVITNAMRAVDRIQDLDPATREITEKQLAALAADRSPRALADAAAEILARLDQDGAAPTEDEPPENELHLVHSRDGSLAGKFRVRDPITAEAIRTAVEPATPPPGADGDPTPPGASLSTDRDGFGSVRSRAERQAQAFADLATDTLNRGLDHHESPAPEAADAADVADSDDLADSDDHEDPNDLVGGEDPVASADPGAAVEPPTHDRRSDRPPLDGGRRVEITATIPWELLSSPPPEATDRSQRGGRSSPALGFLGSGQRIGPETARRLACDAEVIPAVLGGRSQPLDIGRRSRAIPRSLRAALILRDRHCAHPGCRRRARVCVGHHILHWAHGGDTAIDNLVLVCEHHHALIHHGGWSVHMIDGLPWFRAPRWSDPTQRLRHNRPWRADPTPRCHALLRPDGGAPGRERRGSGAQPSSTYPRPRTVRIRSAPSLRRR